MEYIEIIGDILGYLVPGVIVLLGIIAAIRVVIKTRRGEGIDVPPVGVANDLPSSVTGMNKHFDSEVLNNDQHKKRGGE